MVFFADGAGSVAVASTPAGVAAVMRAAFSADVVEVASAAVAYRQRVVREERFAFGDAVVDGEVVSEAGPLPFFVVADVLRGSQVVTAGRERWERRSPEPFLFPMLSKEVQWVDVRLRQTVVKVTALDRFARDAGLPPVQAMRFCHAPVDANRLRHWDGVVAQARRFAVSPMFRDAPLSRTAVFGLIASAFLDAFVVRRGIEAESVRALDAGRATVRRAVSFIQDHADEDLGVADIAAAVGVSVRSVQYAFQRYADAGPLHTLRHERLRRARQDLMAASPRDGVTVGSTAARWGFTHQGRFASEYAHVFGEFPAATLYRE